MPSRSTGCRRTVASTICGPVPRTEASLRLDRMPRPFSPKLFLWKNFFIGVDDALKGWERRGPRPLRARALEAARRWLEERLACPAALAGSFPRWSTPSWRLRSLGYPDDHPLVRGQLKEIEALGIETARTPPLPAVCVAGVGHRARRQCADRVRLPRR
jgi:hypothetical protein